MDAIYDLKEMLCKELEEYGNKGELTPGSLEVIDKLAHAVKNLHKIIEAYEEEEEGSYAGSYRGSYRGSYAQGGGQGGQGGNMGGGSNRGSYARGRGRNARRDSRGRYSSEGGYSRAAEDMKEQLRELMEQAPNEMTRRELEKLVERMEQM